MPGRLFLRPGTGSEMCEFQQGEAMSSWSWWLLLLVPFAVAGSLWIWTAIIVLMGTRKFRRTGLDPVSRDHGLFL
jgi:hypothetical protein